MMMLPVHLSSNCVMNPYACTPDHLCFVGNLNTILLCICLTFAGRYW
uniref:Uncharacterized protein n=1 Tax=Arundo donax TaxID=35708 RepID=A0A0A9FNB5_ARUDO